jgi:hypothetical protein
MTDRELEAIKELAELIKNGWGANMNSYTLKIIFQSELISQGYSPKETETAINYILED